MVFFYQFYSFGGFNNFKQSLSNIDIVLEFTKHYLRVDYHPWSYLIQNINYTPTPSTKNIESINEYTTPLKPDLCKPKSTRTLMLDFIKDSKVQELLKNKKKN